LISADPSAASYTAVALRMRNIKKAIPLSFELFCQLPSSTQLLQC
jgi:hypothetical protein